MKRDEVVTWQMELVGSAFVRSEVHTPGAMPTVVPCSTMFSAGTQWGLKHQPKQG